jgi:hypothetical protein
VGKIEALEVQRADPGFSYLQAMQHGFERACRSVAPKEVTIEIAGTCLQLRISGAEMAAAVLTALAPRIRQPAADLDFTVDIWESAATGVKPPRPPWGVDDGGPHGAVRGYNDERRIAISDPTQRVITLADLDKRVAVVWAASGAALSDFWRASPLRMLLTRILAAPGRHAVHAGAVGTNGRAVLLAGSGGVGKSTLAIRCVEAGMGYLGDDYVLVARDPTPTVHSLYSTARLDRRAAGLCTLGTHATFRGDTKAVLDLNSLAPSRVRDAMPLAAVLIPRRTRHNNVSRMRAVSASRALLAIAPSTIFQATGGGTAALELIADLLRRVPAYELETGSPTDDAPAVLSALLRGGR